MKTHVKLWIVNFLFLIFEFLKFKFQILIWILIFNPPPSHKLVFSKYNQDIKFTQNDPTIFILNHTFELQSSKWKPMCHFGSSILDKVFK